MAQVPFEAAAAKVDEFLALLESIGVSVAADSQSESDALAMFDVLEVWRRHRPMPTDHRDLVRAALGFVDLAGKVVSVARHRDFLELRPHLELISKGSVLQNSTSSILDDAANKLAELYIGCLVMKQFTNVSIDHPIKAKGDNPDVMFDFRGQRWALALKTLHSSNPQTIFDNIRRASDQIEASKAQYGLIVLNTKNLLSHNALWPSPDVSQPEENAKAALIGQLNAIALSLRWVPAEDWKSILGPARKAKPPILFLGQSAFSAVPTYPVAGPQFMPLKIFHAHLVPEGDPVGSMKLANGLTHEMQEFL
jgi:hypothetical protein